MLHILAFITTTLLNQLATEFRSYCYEFTTFMIVGVKYSFRNQISVNTLKTFSRGFFVTVLTAHKKIISISLGNALEGLSMRK